MYRYYFHTCLHSQRGNKEANVYPMVRKTLKAELPQSSRVRANINSNFFRVPGGLPRHPMPDCLNPTILRASWRIASYSIWSGSELSRGEKIVDLILVYVDTETVANGSTHLDIPLYWRHFDIILRIPVATGTQISWLVGEFASKFDLSCSDARAVDDATYE